MRTHVMDKMRCPECMHEVDRATNAERGVRSRPKPGDLTVCIGCAAPLQFTEHGLRTFTELDKLSTHERAALRAAVRAVKSVLAS